ncbi:MAG: aspartate kinase [Lachnospiraceae bacterium]|jgi:aspartate kinase|nr:aspartate kinase [Lachnospiraceae bacterium]
MIKVVKFGGTSLASAKQFEKVLKIIQKDEGRTLVVPSAPGRRTPNDRKVTDMLYNCHALALSGQGFAEELSNIKSRFDDIISGLGLHLSLDEEFEKIKNKLDECGDSDYTASRGEYLNGLILAAYLEFPFLDAKDLVIFNDNKELEVDETNHRLKEALRRNQKAVIPGFYGAKRNGEIVTFSRGGSDITGSLIAKAVNADMYENWTDVSGFLIADPAVVNNPKSIDVLTYRELRELSYMGAGVLHEASIFPVRKEGIPINIRNTNSPDDKGTLIVESTCRQPRFTITGIAGKRDFASITIEKAMMNSEIGFCKRVLEVFEDNHISIEHMPSGIDTMTIFVHKDEFEENEQKVIAGIHRAVSPDMVELESDLALVAVVGRGMKSTRGTSGRIFSALAHANVNVKMIDQGSSELNIIIGVRNNDFETAIRAIYDIFVSTQI